MCNLAGKSPGTALATLLALMPVPEDGADEENMKTAKSAGHKEKSSQRFAAP
jgi:hypothetical protein